jgi:hypothetical protein
MVDWFMIAQSFDDGGLDPMVQSNRHRPLGEPFLTTQDLGKNTTETGFSEGSKGWIQGIRGIAVCITGQDEDALDG